MNVNEPSVKDNYRFITYFFISYGKFEDIYIWTYEYNQCFYKEFKKRETVSNENYIQ